MRSFFPILPSCAALLAAALISGCGIGGGDDEISGISEITPPDASLYFDAVIRPEGEQKEQLEGFLTNVLDTEDVGGEITELIDEEFEQEGEERTFADDVDPWLGDEAGVFTVGLEDDPPAVAAVQSDDPAAGVELLRSESKKLKDAEHMGSQYQIDEEGQAFGEIGDFVVRGDEAAYRAAIEASEGESLADSDRFDEAVKDVPEDAIGRGYLDLENLIAEAAEGEGVPKGVSEDVLQQVGIEQSLVAAATTDEDNLALDIEGFGDLGAKPPAILGELPEDAFLAVGVGDVGKAAEELIQTIEDVGIPGLSRDVIAAALQSQYGLDLDEDFLSWVGDAAFFLRGTDPAALEGALVFDSTDDVAAARALDKLGQFLESGGTASVEPLSLGGAGGNGFELETVQFPQALNVVQRNGKVVIGMGDAATEQSLNPTETLEDSGSFTTATGSLGDAGPAFYLSIPEAVGLAEQDPESSADPDFKQIQPYLERLAFLTAGSNEGGIRIVLGAE